MSRKVFKLIVSKMFHIQRPVMVYIFSMLTLKYVGKVTKLCINQAKKFCRNDKELSLAAIPREVVFSVSLPHLWMNSDPLSLHFGLLTFHFKFHSLKLPLQHFYKVWTLTTTLPHLACFLFQYDVAMFGIIVLLITQCISSSCLSEGPMSD